MTTLEPDHFFHIYNRSNGKETIFLNAQHYHFFLSKQREYILPIVDTFSYCLMPNHFHFLIRIKSEAEINQHRDLQKVKSSKPVDLYVSKRFSNLFSSYSQAFNKQQHRTGSLFQKRFKRKNIDSEKYLYQLIHYIHNNPVAANLVEKPIDWDFSSYPKLISDKATFLQKKEVLNLYDDLENFKIVHSRPMAYDRPFQEDSDLPKFSIILTRSYSLILQYLR